MHRDDLLAPASVHFVIGPHGRTIAARGYAGLIDLAAHEPGVHVPAGIGPPVVVDADHGGVAIEKRPLDARRDEPEVLCGEVAHDAQRAEGASGVVLLIGGEYSVLGGAEA